MTAYPGGTNYYFPWYDDQYGLSWVLISNPAGGADAVFDMYLNSDPLISDFHVPGRQSEFQRFAGRLGGPLMVDSHNGAAMVSERSLFGDSFEEIWATPYEELDSHYYWPIYNGYSMDSWVLISNPLENGEDVKAELSIITVALEESDPDPPDILEYRVIHPGESWTPSYPGQVGNPVQVKAYRDGGSPDDPADARKVIASERTLLAGAFNEMPGIPASKLDSSYYWTWYDSENSYNSITVGNPNAFTIYATVYIGGIQQEPPSFAIQAGAVGGWVSKAPLLDGPVKIEGCLNDTLPCDSPANIYASQIVFYTRSYEETAGMRLADLQPEANWTWYDMNSPGSQNWVLVANIQDFPIHYEITGPGISTATYPEASGDLAPGANETPVFPGKIGGPLQVKAWNRDTSTPVPVMASQRVLWNGYFNEVVGKGL